MSTTSRALGVKTWGGKIKNIVGGKTPPDPVAPLKTRLNRIELAIKALPATPAPIAPDTRGVLDRSRLAIVGTVGLLPPAPQPAALKTEDEKIRRLDTETTEAGSFLLEYEKAARRERELIVLNRPGQSHQTAVHAAIVTAGDEAGRREFSKAAETLKTTGTLAKTARKAAEEQTETVLNDARLKPLYLNKVARINNAIDELKPLPGTAAAIAKLEKLLRAGDDLARPGGYKKAYDALEGLSGTLEAGRKAAAQFGGKVGDPAFRTLLTQVQRDLATYAGLIPQTTPDVATTLQERIDTLLQQQDTDPPPTDLTVAKKTLGDIGKAVTDGLGKLQKDAQDWEALIGEVDKKISMVQAAVTADVYQPVLASFRACSTLHGLRDNAAAVADLRKLNRRCEELVLLHGPMRDRWEKLSGQVETAHWQTLQDTNGMEVKGLAQITGPLLAGYGTARETVPNSRDFTAGVTAAEAVIDQMPRLVQPILEAYAKLADQRLEFDKAVELEKKALQQQIDLLDKAGGDTAAARRSLSEAGNLWIGAKAGESDAVALATARDRAVDLLKTATPATADLQKEPALGVSKTARVAGERQGELDGAARTLNQALQRLREEYPDDVTSFEGLRDAALRVATTETTAGRPVPRQQLDQLAELARQVQQQLDKRRQEADGASERARQAASAVAKRVKTLKGRHGDFKSYFESIEAEVQDAGAMAESTVRKVIEAGLAQLSAGGAVFDRVVALETSTAFGAVTTALENIDTGFDDPALKATRANQLKTLKLRLKDEIKPAAYALSPTGAAKTLTDFLAEVNQAKAEALKAQNDRLEVRRLADEARELLAGMTKSDAPKVHAMLSDRLKAAAKVVEGREGESLSQLNSLIVTLGRLTGGAEGVDRQIVEMERQIETREFDARRGKAEFDAKVDLFDKNQARDAEAIYKETSSSTRDGARYAEIARLRKEAAKLAGRGQHAAALQQLAAAIAEADGFIANPLNGATSSRGQLKKAGVRWAAAVGEFVGRLNALGEAIGQQADEDVQADPTTDRAPYDAAVAAVGELALSFNPEHFTGVIESLTRDGLNLTQVRDAKENALRLLRGVRDTLASDPLLKQVATNPFDNPVPLKPLADRLNDLDLNFQRF